MKRIKNFKDACKALKLNPENLPLYPGLPEKHKKSLIAYYQLIIIAEALNEGWVPDWNNYDECKYYPWFDFSGGGFSFGDFDYDRSVSNVGSRLCFKTKELAKYVGKNFIKLYKDYFLIY